MKPIERSTKTIRCAVTALALVMVAHSEAAWMHRSVASDAIHPTLRIRTNLLGVDHVYLTYLQKVTSADWNVVVAYPSGNSWTQQVVDEGSSGVAPQLAIDTAGKVHVTYGNRFGQPRYARRASPGGAWVSQTIPVASGGIIQTPIYVAAGFDGAIHFAYGIGYSFTSFDTHYLRLNADGSWTAPASISISVGKPVNFPQSLVLDSSNLPHIGHGGGGAGGVRNLYSGGPWIAYDFGLNGLTEAIDLHLYFDQPVGCYSTEQKVVGLAEHLRGSFTLTDIGSATADRTGECSLVIKTTGAPAVAYIAPARSGPVLRVTSRGSRAVWESDDIAHNTVGRPSLARTQDNRLWIAYTVRTGPDSHLFTAQEQ